MRRLLPRLLLAALALGGAGLAHGQDEGIPQRKQERILAQKAKQQKKEQAKAEKEGRKRHLGLQDKAARKRIKRNLKQAERHGGGGGQRQGWPARLFKRKR